MFSILIIVRTIQVYSKVSFLKLLEILGIYYFLLDEMNSEMKTTKTVMKVMNIR